MVGFRCHDRDLSMPYVETGDELIPLLMLLSLAFAGPAASVSPSHTRVGGGLKGVACAVKEYLKNSFRTPIFPFLPRLRQNDGAHASACSLEVTSTVLDYGAIHGLFHYYNLWFVNAFSYPACNSIFIQKHFIIVTGKL